MLERTICLNWYIAGTLIADHALHAEFPFPVRLESIKAHASNDSDATLAVTGIVTAAVIGDSDDPVTLTPTGAEVAQVAKDTQMVFDLDYDGASGTAAANVQIIAIFKTGEG